MSLRKVAVIGVAALALLLLAMPFVIGSVAQKTIQNWHAVNGNDATFSLMDYRRGWFASKIQFEIALEQVSNQKAILDCNAHHGVFSATFYCWPDNKDLTTGAPAWKLQSRVSLFGGIDSELSLEALAFSSASLNINIDSAKITLRSSRFHSKHLVSGSIGMINVVNRNEKTVVSGIRINGGFEYLSAGLPSGELTVSGLAKLDSSLDGKLFKFSGDVDLYEKENKLNLLSSIKFQREIEPLAGSQFSIGEPAQWQERLSVNASSFDKTSVQSALMKWIQATIAAQDENTQQDSNARYVELLSHYYQLMAKGTVLKIDYQSTMPKRIAQASYQIELLDDLNLGDHLLLRLSPKTYTDKFKIAFQLDSEIPWQTGFPTEFRDGRYRTHFTLSPEAASLNNRPLSTEEVLSLLPNFH